MTNSTQKYLRRAHASQRGIAIVEFMIVLPLVLFLILGVSEFGRGFMQYNTLTRSVRDAVRHASNNALLGQTQVVNITGQLQTETINLVTHGNIAGTGASILPDLTSTAVTVNDEGGGDISVTATYAYQPIVAPFIPSLLQNGPKGGIFNIRAQVIMKAL